MAAGIGLFLLWHCRPAPSDKLSKENYRTQIKGEVMFSVKKMLKKCLKVGLTAAAGSGGVLGISGGEISHGFWVGLASAVLTAAVNFIAESLKEEN